MACRYNHPALNADFEPGTMSPSKQSTDQSSGLPDERTNTRGIGLTGRLSRRIFRVFQKDKNLKELCRKFWPVCSVSIDGLNFDLHPVDNSTERNLYLNGTLEEKDSLLTLADKASGQRCIIYDIGANCGLYSVLLARATGSGSMIHAFEPSPTMAERLRHNIALNQSSAEIKIHQVALSAEHGKVTLNIHQRNHGQSSLRNLERSTNSIEVEQLPLLDVYQSREGFDKVLIKIDVEGREDNVLGPFISGCSDENLPDEILLEMVLEDSWNVDLRSTLLKRGYEITFEGDGNALFSLQR